MLTSFFGEMSLIYYIISQNTCFFNDNDTYLNHDDTLLFTMTLIFEISVIVICFGAKWDGFKSPNLDFRMVNFDIMKRISFVKILKSLMSSHFGKKKRNVSIVSILAFQYGPSGETRLYLRPKAQIKVRLRPAVGGNSPPDCCI